MVVKTKWYSLREVSKQLSRKGVGRTNLITILKQEGLIKDNKQPKPALVSKGFFRVKEYLIKTRAGYAVKLKVTQVSNSGINLIENVLQKRDDRIDNFIVDSYILAETYKVFIRSEIKAI